jgi:hypothetical protein
MILLSRPKGPTRRDHSHNARVLMSSKVTTRKEEAFHIYTSSYHLNNEYVMKDLLECL